MEQHYLTWTIIDKTADKLGVSDAARKKWRSRRVPWEWRVKIVEDLKLSGITVAVADFDVVESNRLAA